MDVFLTVAYDMTAGVPWWAWMAVLAMMFWKLLVPDPDADRPPASSLPEALAQLWRSAAAGAPAADRARSRG